MSGLERAINYKQLLARHGRVQIPIIQRDYAQGRLEEEEIREDFLSALELALNKPTDDLTLPLNLDFIYGSTEGSDVTRFLPLDGQQRLTTLFLLHWYLAWVDGAWTEFTSLFKVGDKSRFSYVVRTSSNEFFDALVCFAPVERPTSVHAISSLIVDQPWYVRSWRLDPTIQSVLFMLDAIHSRFSTSKGLFSRLVDEESPTITFQLLELDNFGLSDDLYIKMNARGKPLTQFETFKARYERELKELSVERTFHVSGKDMSIAEYVSWRLDNAWADLFWASRNQASNLYDAALMNFFRVVALVTRTPDAENYLEDVGILNGIRRSAAYGEFHTRNWLDEKFTLTLISVLDSLSSGGGSLSTQLPNSLYFDELYVFQQIVASAKRISLSEIVQLAGYMLFLDRYKEEFSPAQFQAWMRVIANLSNNTDYNRPEDLQRSIRSLWSLLPSARTILDHLADSESDITGYSKQQIDEERLKARLLLADPTWEAILTSAEAHGYFHGQIEFLLDWSGVLSKHENSPVDSWAKSDHDYLQGRFKDYFSKAVCMFGKSGLNAMPEYLWQRALLTIGNYFLGKNSNYSFLIDSASEPESWKRLLRGDRPSTKNARRLLQQLLDRLDQSADISSQLKGLVSAASGPEHWVMALIKTPAAFVYCQSSFLRWDKYGQVYLLKKTQMNGKHAELFTFALHKSLISEASIYAPLRIQPYVDVSGSEFEPYFILNTVSKKWSFQMTIFHADNFFFVRLNSLLDTPKCDLQAALKEFGFSSTDDETQIYIDRMEIVQRVVGLSAAVRKLDEV